MYETNVPYVLLSRYSSPYLYVYLYWVLPRYSNQMTHCGPACGGEKRGGRGRVGLFFRLGTPWLPPYPTLGRTALAWMPRTVSGMVAAVGRLLEPPLPAVQVAMTRQRLGTGAAQLVPLLGPQSIGRSELEDSRSRLQENVYRWPSVSQEAQPAALSSIINGRTTSYLAHHRYRGKQTPTLTACLV